MVVGCRSLADVYVVVVVIIIVVGVVVFVVVVVTVVAVVVNVVIVVDVVLGAGEQYAKLRTNDGYGIHIPGSGHILRVVSSYKHLGCDVQNNGSNMKYVIQRASRAMSAYVPIAVRVFGSPRLDNKIKFNLCSSLVESRLLFNCHVRNIHTCVYPPTPCPARGVTVV